MVNIIYPQRTSISAVSSRPSEIIDISGVRKALKAGRKRKGALLETEKAFYNLCVAFIKKIVAPQWADDYCLNLSNDDVSSKVLGCSPRQARRARHELSKAGVLYVPDWARQKKMGDYPIWFLNFEFVKNKKVEEVEKVEEVAPKKVRKSKYVDFYQVVKKDAVKLAYKHFDDEFDECDAFYGGESVRDVMVYDFIAVRESYITDILQNMNLSRADILR